MTERRVILRALHGVRLVGFGSDEHVATRAGLEPATVRVALTRASESGWTQFRVGRVEGWTLTAGGRRHAESLLAQELAASGRALEVERAFEEFLALNPELLELCTAWQLRPEPGGAPILNDHSDPAYDAAVVEGFRDLHARALPLVTRLAAALDRFDRYRPRLSEALVRVEAGEVDWLTKPVIESFHTVWFELHEDLLATLGRERVPSNNHVRDADEGR